MIYDRIDFHNVEELVSSKRGFALNRLPGAVRKQLNEGARTGASYQCSGVELRFRILSGEVDLYMRTEDATEALPALIYYGSFQGGWEYSARAIGEKMSRLHIRSAQNLPVLQKMTEEKGLLYRPEMVRVLLPYSKCVYLGIDGDIEPPHPGDAPERICLSYGSSITHGSLALGAQQSYSSRIARSLGCDHINLGLAGCCHLEEAMAHYLCSRKDWDVCTVEMGINMLKSFSEEAFEERVARFVEIMHADGRPVFTTSMFAYAYPDQQEKGHRFREIVARQTAGKLPFIDGLELLGDPSMVADDLVHPSLEAHEQIAERWSHFIRSYLNK